MGLLVTVNLRSIQISSGFTYWPSVKSYDLLTDRCRPPVLISAFCSSSLNCPDAQKRASAIENMAVKCRLLKKKEKEIQKAKSQIAEYRKHLEAFQTGCCRVFKSCANNVKRRRSLEFVINIVHVCGREEGGAVNFKPWFILQYYANSSILVYVSIFKCF